VFVKNPMGYEDVGNEHKVYKLKKTFIDLSKHQGIGTISYTRTFIKMGLIEV